MQPRVSSAAGPAPATGTAQAGAADSCLVQRREGSGACRLVLTKHQHFFLCFKPEKQPHTAFHPHLWQQIFPYGRASPPSLSPGPPFPLPEVLELVNGVAAT